VAVAHRRRRETAPSRVHERHELGHGFVFDELQRCHRDDPIPARIQTRCLEIDCDVSMLPQGVERLAGSTGRPLPQ
jgi:hypothetical protein